MIRRASSWGGPAAMPAQPIELEARMVDPHQRTHRCSTWQRSWGRAGPDRRRQPASSSTRTWLGAVAIASLVSIKAVCCPLKNALAAIPAPTPPSGRYLGPAAGARGVEACLGVTGAEGGLAALGGLRRIL